MAITVVNKYKEPDHIYCGRGSALGNPFFMTRNSQQQRDYVCDLYEEYFQNQVERKVTVFMAALLDIQNKAMKGNVNLGCFCAPKRCHCDTIKKYVDNKLKEAV